MTNKITITDEDLKNNKITLNFTGSVKTRAGEEGEWFTSSSVVDLHTILTTNKGQSFDLGILKGEVGDTGILVADAYLDTDFNLIIVDTQNNIINAGSTVGLAGDNGTEGLYPVSVSVSSDNHLLLTMNDDSVLDLGALSTRIMKVGDVIYTYATITDTNYLEISLQSYTITKTDYPELHFHITNDSVDEIFTVQQLVLSDLNVYIKAL